MVLVASRRRVPAISHLGIYTVSRNNTFDCDCYFSPPSRHRAARAVAEPISDSALKHLSRSHFSKIKCVTLRQRNAGRTSKYLPGCSGARSSNRLHGALRVRFTLRYATSSNLTLRQPRALRLDYTLSTGLQFFFCNPYRP